MIIGYLILPHDSPHHFARLVHALKDEHTYIHVHVDRKSSILPFRERVPANMVQFINDRISVYWGEFSQVQAIINLMCESLSCGPRFDYLCLLSGTDYPFQRAQYIRGSCYRNSNATTENTWEGCSRTQAARGGRYPARRAHSFFTLFVTTNMS
jgi:Core-2/I-Branching enzyme